MNSNKTEASANGKAQVCPYLGLKYDPATAISFSSVHNHCNHARPVQPVKLKHQVAYCLTMNYLNCDEYIREPNTPLITNLRLKRSSRPPLKFNLFGFLVLLLVAAVIIFLVWQGLSRGLWGIGDAGHSPAKVPVSTSPVEIGSQTPTLSTPLLENTPTPTILVTETLLLPFQTFSPTPGLLHVLETPIGAERKLVIHRVVSGESITSIANHYWTTAEAIQAINYHMRIPLLVDWLIVVPINQTDVLGMPVFEVYLVKANETVENLAKQLSIDLAMLKQYNGFTDAESLEAGEWVVIPHQATPTP